MTKSVDGTTSEEAQEEILASLTTNLGASRPYCRYQYVAGQTSTGTPVSLNATAGQLIPTNQVGSIPLYQVSGYGWGASGNPDQTLVFQMSGTLRIAPGQPSPAPWTVSFSQNVPLVVGATTQILASAQTSSVTGYAQFLSFSAIVRFKGQAQPSVTYYAGPAPSPIDVLINPSFNLSFFDFVLLGIY